MCKFYISENKMNLQRLHFHILTFITFSHLLFTLPYLETICILVLFINCKIYIGK